MKGTYHVRNVDFRKPLGETHDYNTTFRHTVLWNLYIKDRVSTYIKFHALYIIHHAPLRCRFHSPLEDWGSSCLLREFCFRAISWGVKYIHCNLMEFAYHFPLPISFFTASLKTPILGFLSNLRHCLIRECLEYQQKR